MIEVILQGYLLPIRVGQQLLRCASLKLLLRLLGKNLSMLGVSVLIVCHGRYGARLRVKDVLQSLPDAGAP